MLNIFLAIHGTSIRFRSERDTMPPRREPKETVVYPASKRKAPPFKPQRPSKVPRVPTAESEGSNPKAARKVVKPARRKSAIHDDDEDESDNEQTSASVRRDEDSSDEELPDDPLASIPPKQTKSSKRPAPKRKPPRQPSPMSVSSELSSNPPLEPPSPAFEQPPSPSQSNGVPALPQPLLVRLLHEHFTDETTKIDKQATQVLQKYFEVFLRETIARARMRKKEDAEKEGGGIDDAETSWLELDDLEKVAAGMNLDF